MSFIKLFNMHQMKNIGVLTHCIADNYGANLQALSTAFFLKNNGFNPVFFKWDPYLTNQNIEQLKLHVTFLERHGFEVTENCEKDDDFIHCIEKYNIDFVIEGSDCVLSYSKPIIPFALTRKGIVRKKILKDWAFPNPFWMPYLGKTPGLRAVIMSGSCGCSDLGRASGNIKEQMKECLNNYSMLTVRDDYTKQSLFRILGNKAEELKITPDPVFAFNQNKRDQPSKEETLKKFNLPEKYVVIGFYENYMPSNTWLCDLKKSLNKRGIKLVNLPMPQGGKEFKCDINIHLPLDSLDWYCIIKYSAGYVGNNMHPIIVAMHNSVPFYSIDAHGKYYLRGVIQKVNNTKEYELLNRFNLLKYHTAFKHIEKVSPEKVVNLLLTFDKSYCKSCAQVLLDEYTNMMDEILRLI